MAGSAWWSPLSFVTRKATELAVGGSNHDAAAWRADGYEQPASFFDLRCRAANGQDFDLCSLRGKVCIVVNVASL